MEHRKLWSRRNLPEELLTEILSRLPVKTLLRFRCVRKQWRALIDDPDFARLHLRLFNNNRCETHLLSYYPMEPLSLNKVEVRCIQSLEVTSRLHIPQTIVDFQQHDFQEPLDSWHRISSIDGLFMLQTASHSRWPPRKLMLWNPATRKTLTLPHSPEFSTPGDHLFALDLALGFDPSVKDYKHVRVIPGLHLIAVYSLATNTWKVTRCDQDILQGIREVDEKGLCLKGFLFSLATMSEAFLFDQDLVSFDFRSEKLASIKLPVEGIAPRIRSASQLTMADDGSSLAVVFCSEGSGSMWVMEGLGADGINSCTWSKRYTIASVIPEYDNQAIGGNLFYLLKNSELLLYWNDMITSYNLKANKDKEKVIIKEELYIKPLPYIESLVSIP